LEAGPPAARDAAVAMGVGTFEELVDLYGRAWVTVLPSSHEAFGLVLVESLACGTPVVTLSGGPPAELVTPDTGATASADAFSLAAALGQAIELARDPRTRDACRAAAEPHDWQRGIVPRMESIYRDDIPRMAS
ncbi:MAG: glycosyltransferase, partial [Actinomycetota bacterium]